MRASKELMRRIEDVVDLYTGGSTDKFLAMVEVSSPHHSCNVRLPLPYLHANPQSIGFPCDSPRQALRTELKSTYPDMFNDFCTLLNISCTVHHTCCVGCLIVSSSSSLVSRLRESIEADPAREPFREALEQHNLRPISSAESTLRYDLQCEPLCIEEWGHVLPSISNHHMAIPPLHALQSPAMSRQKQPTASLRRHRRSTQRAPSPWKTRKTW